jgi:hypothetical protein
LLREYNTVASLSPGMNDLYRLLKALSFIFRVEQRRRTPGLQRDYPGKALHREKHEKQQSDGGVLKVQPQSYAMSS